MEDGEIEVLGALSYAHAVEVLDCLEDGGKRFSEIERGTSLDGNYVYHRLKDLRIAELVEREGVVRDRRASLYRLTDRGEEALRIAKELENLHP